MNRWSGTMATTAMSAGVEGKDIIKDIEFIIQDIEYEKSCNKSWARFIKRIYEVDPLICPKCGGNIRIIAFT